MHVLPLNVPRISLRTFRTIEAGNTKELTHQPDTMKPQIESMQNG